MNRCLVLPFHNHRAVLVSFKGGAYPALLRGPLWHNSPVGGAIEKGDIQIWVKFRQETEVVQSRKHGIIDEIRLLKLKPQEF